MTGVAGGRAAAAPRVLLVGCGLHSRRAHLPNLLSLAAEGAVQLGGVVDRADRVAEVRAAVAGTFAAPLGTAPPEVVGVPPAPSGAALPDRTARRLDELVHRTDIDTVIVSTEPTSHYGYVRWALERGLSVLVDKPVTLRPGVVGDHGAAEGMLEDYRTLVSLYDKTRAGDPGVRAGVVAHRRFNAAFNRVRQLVSEVYDRTRCPVTSLTTEHTDGEWRMPWEVCDQDYHPFNTGYGVFGHSGYHALDAALWLSTIPQAEPTHRWDSMAVHAQLVTPADHAAAIGQSLSTVFDSADLPPGTLDFNATDGGPGDRYGEIDGRALVALRRGAATITTLSLTVLHCSYSQRAWPHSTGRDLYVGNGRVRQELYSLQQGPFQTIKLSSWRALPDTAPDQPPEYGLGGRRHVEVVVFRNSALFPDWHTVQRFDATDLRGHSVPSGQEKAAVLAHFLSATRTGADLRSDLADHHASMTLLSGIYRSWTTRSPGTAVVLEREGP